MSQKHFRKVSETSKALISMYPNRSHGTNDILEHASGCMFWSRRPRLDWSCFEYDDAHL